MKAAILLFVACAGRPPATPCPTIPVSAVAAPEVPAPDDKVAAWKAVAAGGALPAGVTPAAAVPELVGYLGSPDPVRRDQIAFELLSKWIKDDLSDTDLRGLRDRLLSNLTKPTVFERSFSILVLSSLVRRDVAKPFLTDAERRALLVAVRDYAQRETDLRGYTGATGWAHAAAHSGDLLAQLAKEPLTDDDRAIVLDAVAGFTTRRHGQILAYGEDGRLAVAIVVAARNGLPKAKLDAFVAGLIAPLAEQGGEAFDAGLFAAQRNARNLLFTLYVQASLANPATDGDKQLLAAVSAALAG